MTVVAARRFSGFSRPFLLGAGLLAATLLVSACGSSSPAPADPLFTDPVVKLAQTADESFTWTIYQEALALQPLLGATGTQVHMGYYSGPGNRARLIALIDQVNTPAPGSPARWAVWDEGVSTAVVGKYPSFVTMEAEHWYERAQAEVGGYDTLTIAGFVYTDPHPVTYDQADLIWGQLSDRYAETAASYHRATGNKAQAWALVYGADLNRVFFHYECPRLATLRFWEHVTVQCSRVADASWQRPADWCDCSLTCTPCPS